MSRQRLLFVTGRLAEFTLRQTLTKLQPQLDFDFDVTVLKISVAALMHVEWVKRQLELDYHYDKVILPGWCQGDLEILNSHFETSFERGPKDCLDLPSHFGAQKSMANSLENYNIEILAEINHAPRLAPDELLAIADHYADSGANVIDVGCIPGESWSGVGDCVKQLKDRGLRVSIDSFERTEVEAAVSAGAELLLSCNSTNKDWAADLGVELVVIPNDPNQLTTWDSTLEFLDQKNVPYRLDPILEPIGFNFAVSLARYFETRRLHPESHMMMGIGNVTELTEVDSAGVNMLLAAICQELNIRSVLTTEVINWSRSSVLEFDRARRLSHFSLTNNRLPKNLDAGLVMLRDMRLNELGTDALRQLADQIRDANYRIFVEGQSIHVMNRDGYWSGTDPFELWHQMMAADSSLDADHAFYLGYELSKAVTALTLGKQYRQDQALNWGILTVPEKSIHEKKRQNESL